MPKNIPPDQLFQMVTIWHRDKGVEMREAVLSKLHVRVTLVPHPKAGVGIRLDFCPEGLREIVSAHVNFDLVIGHMATITEVVNAISDAHRVAFHDAFVELLDKIVQLAVRGSETKGHAGEAV